MEKEKNLIGLMLISWYFKIGGGFMILFGILIPLLLFSMAEYMGDPGQLVWVLFIIGGLFFILLGCLYFFVGRSLDKLKNWARNTIIILSVLQIIISLILMIVLQKFSEYLFGLMLSGVIIYYLFRRDVKESFKN